MKALSLFSGIGGIDLAAEWAGIETVAFCEREPFPQKVLKKHWPNIPIYDDVCTLTKERLEADGIDCGTIGVIHGGYPCQPFSNSGKREGENDDRHLWPEMFRLIQTIHPRWVIGENVAGHVSLGLDTVLADLESVGYAWESFIIPAVSVDARHRRSRVFVLGYSECVRRDWESWRGTNKIFKDRHLQLEEERRSEWAAEPNVGRVANGVPDRVDRLKSLGNAVVPQQIYPILTAIKMIDDLMQESNS